MDTTAHDNSQPKLSRFGVKAGLVVLGLLFFSALIFYPFLVGRAEALLNSSAFAMLGSVQKSQPQADQMNAVMQTITNTLTSTATETLAVMDTATATATPTATDTVQPTTEAPTLTPTATKTGTLPTPTLTATPTVTGTLSPNPTLILKVKPTEAYIGQKFTFDIVIGNSGTGPLTEVVIADSFPSYILVETVASQRGVVSKSQHSFSVSVGNVFPGEVINITAQVRVTSNAVVTETITNIVTMTYAPNKSKTASVTYKVIATALPSTGGLPMVRQQAPPVNSSVLLQSLLTGLLGVLLLAYAIWSRRQTVQSGRWMPVAGVLLLLLAVVSGLVAGGVLGSQPDEPVATVPGDVALPAAPEEQQAVHPRAVDFATPEALPVVTLPVYPIPSPVVAFTPAPGEREPDTTAINRIVIPYLLLDTDVAYVPFDGNTWLISGLTQEVAWMGDTSWPGLGSNTGLAAHVTVTGQGDGPFRYLNELPVGELVFLYTEENIYTYQVREQALVGFDAMYVTSATTNPQITLITCANWSDDHQAWLERLIVYADLVRSDPIMRTGSY